MFVITATDPTAAPSLDTTVILQLLPFLLASAASIILTAIRLVSQRHTVNLAKHNGLHLGRITIW
ncbi:hypothetical protein [Mycobacterium leprae]|uniref:hypothetical protein n=1 Tax=Mycobacterium leprae TaxID=1769 RepID=UPI0022AA684A|nr:hypothetical protein [Mycobacterium leprae]